jgi:hypothetical protein
MMAPDPLLGWGKTTDFLSFTPKILHAPRVVEVRVAASNIWPGNEQVSVQKLAVSATSMLRYV